MSDFTATANGKEITITSPAKLLWPEFGITKLDYIKYLVEAAPYFFCLIQSIECL